VGEVELAAGGLGKVFTTNLHPRNEIPPKVLSLGHLLELIGFHREQLVLSGRNLWWSLL
jgi:hypothetical protein